MIFVEAASMVYEVRECGMTKTLVATTPTVGAAARNTPDKEG